VRLRVLALRRLSQVSAASDPPDVVVAGWGSATPMRDGFKLKRHHAFVSRLSMIFSENRFPLFRIML
jgi:hypothetical protein